MDFKALALIVFTVIYLYQITLAVIHMRSARNPVPVNVADVYDPETYRKWRAYHAEKSRLGIISSTASFIVEMVLLAFNVYAAFAGLFPQGDKFLQLFAVMLLSKTFDIVMAVFDVGSHVVTQAAASISGSTSLDVEATLTSMFNSQIDTMGIGELIGLGLETMVISLCMKIMSVLITVILYGRMIEIYLYVSVAPIPAATVTNREWGTIGTNYLKGLIALAFQGFFIMVCVAIYAVLVASVTVAGNLHSALWSVAAYTVILCFSLFKTGSLSKSIFNAH